MNKEKRNRMRTCSHLLPPPGGEVVRECLDKIDRLDEGLATILAHAGSAIECVDEPGKGYLREICEIVDKVTGEDTSEEGS
jgi:hypothetical protein